MIEVREYIDGRGRIPFREWRRTLDVAAQQTVNSAIIRMKLGNLSNVKAIGGGLLEYKINFGPGYRLYFGRDGATLVVLLAGGTKRRQEDDIKRARLRWEDYKKMRSSVRSGDGESTDS
jgi:putative addiction module killer protein